MAYLLFVFAALVAAVAALPVEHAQSHAVIHFYPTKEEVIKHGKHIDYFAPPHYSYEYAIHDPHTGDVKEQKEERKDDVVKGFYAFKEADGTRRIVHYTADKHNGFNAVVTHEGKPHAAPAPAHHGHHHQVAAPVHHHAPAPAPVHHHVVAAPVHHVVAAPVHHVVAAPVHHHVAAPAHGHYSHGHHDQHAHVAASYVTHVVPEKHHSHH